MCCDLFDDAVQGRLCNIIVTVGFICMCFVFTLYILFGFNLIFFFFALISSSTEYAVCHVTLLTVAVKERWSI